MAEQLANNAASTLNGTITSGATSLVVANGTVFPATGNFRIIIDSELILVGARSGNTLSSLTRGIESTSAAGHTNGAAVTHVLTKGGLDQYLSERSELAYTEVTTNPTSTATTAATATAVITGPSVTYDGTTTVIVEFQSNGAWSTTANDIIVAELYEDSTDLGILVRTGSQNTNQGTNIYARRRYTPTAGAKVLSVRFWNATAARTVTVEGGPGGAGTDMPMFLRVTRI